VRRPEDAFVFVRRCGEFLVLHRSPEQGGYWHSVAGGLEADETAVHAAARELFEETGLRGEPAGAGEPWVYPAGTSEVVVTPFLVDAPPGWEPTLDGEHDDYRWCSPADACELFHWPEPVAELRRLSSE
jgi:dATP pyrophosphohydrolase